MDAHHQNGFGRNRRSRQEAPKVGELFDRQPPQSIEAEMSLLGSLLLDPRMISEVLNYVSKPEQFYTEGHGAIFRAIADVYDAHQSGDLVQIMDTLRDRGVLEQVGGEQYLVELAESVPSPVNAPHYARIVGEKAKLRRLIEAAGQILYDAYHAGELGPDGARDVLDGAEMAVFEIAQEQQSNDPQMLKELLDLELERIESLEGKGVSGLPTGYSKLDELTRGFQAGEMVIIAARPSMGKTALALNLAEQIALGGRTPWDSKSIGPEAPVAFFSLEMTKAAVTQRLLSAYSGIDANRFRSGHRFSDRDWQSLMSACNTLSEAPILIDDTPGLTVLALRARARRMAAQQHIKAIVVDYLQLLSAPSQARESRQVEVSAISRQLKALARELNVPLICLSQLNRATEQREGNRPRMSDLRESGSIEQDADVVMLLHREEYYHINNPEWAEDNPDKVGIAELIIAKQRNGPTGVVKLTWDASTTRFKNHTDADDGWGGYSPAPSDHYNTPSDAAGPPPASRPGPSQGGPADPPGRAPFSPGRHTGPVSDFRDGGGPDRDELDDEIDDLPV